MRGIYILLMTCVYAGALPAQVTEVRVRDRMESPEVLSSQTDLHWTLEFIELWTINAERPAISKRVDSVRISGDPEPGFWNMVGEKFPEGGARLGEISYEFMLMDLKTGLPNNLHAPLASLVSLHSELAASYSLQDQLLSVHFHETWTMDPESATVTKKVTDLTPVIWQRRQTTEGEPINDGETGLPVYFKLKLEQIHLRNPKSPLSVYIL